VIMPAAPGFYHRPTQISQLVDFMVARMLDQLGVEQTLVKRWDGNTDTRD
jgi:4-hydroxy-3-polyprenylbenzoate decarboxylase